MKKKIALITGITGQDGAYLAELLLNKNYIVHGIKRRSSSFNTERIDHLFQERSKDATFFLHYGDLSDGLNITRLIRDIKPDEIYNLAAMSHVRVSFDTPEYTANIDGLGTLRILEAVRLLGLEKNIKIYQASTSELYGKVQETPQNEETPFYPRSPYGVAKMYAYWITKNYREAYKIFASNGILFNHESEYRGETFVTRKITRGISSIAFGFSNHISLGNLDAKRDWGHARDFVKMQWMMLQQSEPRDYVIATGIQHTVREFVEKAAAILDMSITWCGSGVDEVGLDQSGREVVKVDPRYFRPSEVESLLGDSSKAERELGWVPLIGFDDLVEEMIEADLEVAKAAAENSVGQGI